MRKSLHWYGSSTIFIILLFGITFVLPESNAQLADTSTITVHTVDSSGEIFGYFTVLSQGIFGLATDFTTATFTVNNGETYRVGPQDYANMKFDYWQDTGSTIADREFSITADTDFYAVYRNIMDPTPSPDTPKLTIRTTNSLGEETSGYWTVLFENDVEVKNGFSPETFIINSGETYQILMGNFVGRSFDHWDDGSTENPRSFSITSDETHTAYYNEDNICTVTVVMENSLGEEISGAWTVFHVYSEGNLNGEGVRLQTGFSPTTFEGGCGDSYQVVIRDTLAESFVNWDDGSTNEWRTFTVNSDTTFTATFEDLS